jgi:hypothetical protein
VTSLVGLYRERQNELQRKIDEAEDPQRALAFLMREVEALREAYSGDLTVPQVRITSHLFDALSLSLKGFTDALGRQQQRTEPPPAEHPSSRSGRWIGGFSSGKPKRRQPEAPPGHHVSVRIDGRVLSYALAQVCEVIDRAVESQKHVQAPEPIKEPSGLESFPDLLRLLQNLIGDAQEKNANMVVKRVEKMLPQALSVYGLHFESYRPEDASLRGAFDIEDSSDQETGEWVTLLPACMKGDQVILRGRVIKPAHEN